MILHRLTIKGRPVSQKNAKRVYRGMGHPVTATHVKHWHASALFQLRALWRRDPLEGPWALGVIAFLAKGQSMDCDNSAAAPMDALQAAGVIKNDNKFCPLYVDRARDWDNPRVEIVISQSPMEMVLECMRLTA